MKVASLLFLILKPNIAIIVIGLKSALKLKRWGLWRMLLKFKTSSFKIIPFKNYFNGTLNS